MANCKFLRQKKQVQINGEWVDTRSYRYIPYFDGGLPSVCVNGGEQNGKVVLYASKNGDANESFKTIQLDADGNGCVNLVGDYCITKIDKKNSPSSCEVKINGCYVSSLRTNVDTVIVSSSTYNRLVSFGKSLYFTGKNLIYNEFDTSKVTDMGYMFDECSGLTSLDVGSFDTRNVTNMGYMFRNCNSLESLDLSNFDTTNVTTMDNMFYGCSGITSLDLSNFNTSNVTNMLSMFSKCSGLKSLDLSNFDTSKVTDMDNMFNACSGLASLDLSNFNTSKVTYMNSMFDSCSNLTSLTLSDWVISDATDTSGMFDGCGKLSTITMKGCSEGTINKIKAVMPSSAHISTV